ncbi:hypothetical protein QW131_31740 [Roseibium salinum]|nr:hypothetical protein [Roseibium salinum]
MLREMLALNGLPLGSYELLPTGGPRERWHAVQAGTAAGALLNAYFESLAHGEGCRTLISDPDPWDGYQGNVFCAQPAVLATGAVDGFMRAVLRGVDFVLDPANAEHIAQALVDHLGDMTPARAVRVAEALSGQNSILAPGLPVSRSGTRRVMDLRQTYTGKALPFDVESLFDPRAMVLA